MLICIFCCSVRRTSCSSLKWLMRRAYNSTPEVFCYVLYSFLLSHQKLAQSRHNVIVYLFFTFQIICIQNNFVRIPKNDLGPVICWNKTFNRTFDLLNFNTKIFSNTNCSSNIGIIIATDQPAFNPCSLKTQAYIWICSIWGWPKDTPDTPRLLSILFRICSMLSKTFQCFSCPCQSVTFFKYVPMIFNARLMRFNEFQCIPQLFRDNLKILE